MWNVQDVSSGTHLRVANGVLALVQAIAVKLAGAYAARFGMRIQNSKWLHRTGLPPPQLSRFGFTDF
jgi:hypothetical protein